MTDLPQIKRGRQPIKFALTAQEQKVLDQLYRVDGAWTRIEALQHLSEERIREMLRAKVLGIKPTGMGRMIVILAHGRQAVYGYSSGSVSLNRQINRAYFRLALAQLGWSHPGPDGPTRSLGKHDPSTRFVEINTDEGLALVGSRLTGNGYSSKHIGRIAARMKSTALYENFDLILLTPSAKKGQKQAEQHQSFLKVLHVLPDTGDSSGSQVAKVARSTVERPAGPYLSGEAWKHDPQYLTLPARVLHTLQQPRSERIEHALLSLECDGTMSAAQLQRYYGLLPEDVPDIWSVKALLRTTPSQRTSEQAVTFLTLSRKLARLEEHRLAHRAGTGRVRHLLNIPPDKEQWKAEYRGRLTYEEPDALCITPSGEEVAVEYDPGTYPLRVVDNKLNTFRDRGFAGTIWAVSNPLRQRSLTEKIGPRLLQEIVLAEWWI